MRAVNLLTPEMRSSQKGSGAPRPSAMTTPGGVGAFALLGALALIVAGVAGYVLSTNVVKQRRPSLAAVSAKNDATVKRAAELKPYSDFQTLAQRARRHGAGARQRPLRLGAVAARPLPRAARKDVYLSSLKGTVGGGGAGGGSGIRSSISSPGHRARRLHQEPAGRRPPDVPPAQRAGRHPREPLQVREVRHGRREHRQRRHRRLDRRPVRQGLAARASRSSSSSRRPTVADALATRDRRRRRRRRGAAGARRPPPPSRPTPPARHRRLGRHPRSTPAATPGG